MNKHIAARRQWAKFGDCKGLPPGPEENVTHKSHEIIRLDLRPRLDRDEDKEEAEARLNAQLKSDDKQVVCRNCGEVPLPHVHIPHRFAAVPHPIPALCRPVTGPSNARSARTLCRWEWRTKRRRRPKPRAPPARAVGRVNTCRCTSATAQRRRPSTRAKSTRSGAYTVALRWPLAAGRLQAAAGCCRLLLRRTCN